MPSAKKPAKVERVMHEFKTGALKSSSGQKVTNRKQAVAIALSEAGMSKPAKKGGKKRGAGDPRKPKRAESKNRNDKEQKFPNESSRKNFGFN